MMRAVCLAVTAVLALVPDVAEAQQPEIRLDAFWADRPTWHLGGGLTWRAGNYARISTVAGYALGRGAGREYRGELLARLTLDPFRRRRLGFSLGGGLGVSHEAYLVALAELEGPAWRGMTPAAQVGVSRGYRAGVVIRRAVRGRR